MVQDADICSVNAQLRFGVVDIPSHERRRPAIVIDQRKGFV
jgi:hypothetical protein